LQADVKVLAERIADAINRAKAGRIIADSEELHPSVFPCVYRRGFL
jgi:hypothetical protein